MCENVVYSDIYLYMCVNILMRRHMPKWQKKMKLSFGVIKSQFRSKPLTDNVDGFFVLLFRYTYLGQPLTFISP